jgi:hypothetical protein
LKITEETRKRYLTSILNNFVDAGFKRLSVNDGEEEHYGLTITDTIDMVFELELSQITLAKPKNHNRKIGLMIVMEPDQTPADIITDFGATNEDDMAIAQKAIDKGTSA